MKRLLLHEENFQRIPLVGELIRHYLFMRAEQVAQLTTDVRDPDLSIVIRSRNDGRYVQQWFEDIEAQVYSGDIEVIVVDTESTDDTTSYASSQGAKIVPIKQREFTYPKALNMGFQVAKYPYVLTLVGHSNLSNRMMFKSLTYWSQQENLGGICNWPLPNKDGSFWDRLDTLWWFPMLRKPFIFNKPSSAAMSANCSIVKRDVWEQLGGYDERYAGGGEDAAFGRKMIDAGYLVVREPLCTVFHSHGLGLVNALKQRLHWIRIGASKSVPYEAEKLLARRPDLR